MRDCRIERNEEDGYEAILRREAWAALPHTGEEDNYKLPKADMELVRQGLRILWKLADD